MIRSLWVAKTGLEAQQLNVDVISNNLANVTTNGFKRQRPVFEDLLYQQLRQPGSQTASRVLASFRSSTETQPPHHSAARTDVVLLIRRTVRPDRKSVV